VSQSEGANRAGDDEQRPLRDWLELSERERQLVAFEIHDGFVQQATAALMQLQAFRELHRQKSEEAWKAFDSAMGSLEESLREARRLMAGLRPPVLEEAGVVAAIDDLVRDANQREEAEILFSQAVQFDRLSPVLETTIFRIAQESLTNACRHSQSAKVQLSLVQDGDRIRLEVQDWGVGFDPETVDPSRFGLRGIRERARLLAGRAVIETSPGQGTRVTAELPLET
jgi:signal transduction histidine kinase